MRLICTFNDQSSGEILSNYFTHKGIENLLELTANRDWGSSDYSNVTAKIWVYDEDQFEEALKITQEYIDNPQDPRYQQVQDKEMTFLKPPQEKLQEAPLPITKKTQPQNLWAKEPLGI